jgi:DNA-binding NarL/FixJ family response regulator
LKRGNVAGAIEALDASAALARSRHQVIQLGRTLAVLSAAAREHGDATLESETNAELAAVVEPIGPEARGLAWAQGLPSRRSRAVRSIPDGLLSTREREVAALIAQGLTDRQIADRLVITEGTAGVHVSHILNKLGFHRRTEIAS